MARAYDVPFSSLFEPEPEAEDLVVVRASEGKAQRGNGLLYRRLSDGGWAFNLQPLRVVPAEREGGALYRYEGEQWLYVLSSRLRFGIGDGQTYTATLLSEDGDRIPSGTFVGTSSVPVECNLNAALLRPDVAGLEVRGAGDELLLYADLPEQAQVPSSGGFLSWASLTLWGNAAEAEEPELMEIPEVEDLPVEEAEEKLREAGFGTEIIREKSRPEEDGKVLDQSPSGGEKLREGASVVLTVGEVPTEAGEEPEGGSSPQQAVNPEAPTAPALPGDGAEAPLPLPPPAGDEGEAVPLSPTTYPEPSPAPAPAAPYSPPPPSGEQEEPVYDEQPTEEQYPAEPPPSYEQQPEQPYPEGEDGGSTPEDPAYEDRGMDDSGYDDAGYSGPENPDRDGSDDSEPAPRGSEREEDSGYGGSAY